MVLQNLYFAYFVVVFGYVNKQYLLFILIMYLAGAATLEEISIGLMDKFIYDHQQLNAYQLQVETSV